MIVHDGRTMVIGGIVVVSSDRGGVEREGAASGL